ncbi:hypothetical protein L3476_01405 [Paenibacillus thiaminolyticus]|uniref:hypothetical protein n=1 Tax=Paenibacillus thiaminolyticus TaxID=49283 RepID=UPI002350C934|nr:hypothetical protein [Paenibacillus thiaminolyticus]WCR27466.1 hypothetical protein L3476_01405 [Paenibacillus thiaminolyticus]
MSKGTKIGLGIAAAIIGFIALMIVWYFNTAAGQRSLKNFQSNNAGGLERTVKVYSSDGTLIHEYEGKIDIKDTEYGNKVLFDLDGKRIVIYNATVITEEK